MFYTLVRREKLFVLTLCFYNNRETYTDRPPRRILLTTCGVRVRARVGVEFKVRVRVRVRVTFGVRVSVRNVPPSAP